MIWLIWLVFAIMFLGLAFGHYKKSKKIMPNFDKELTGKARKINSIDTGLDDMKDFISYFREYIDKFNLESKKLNRLAMWGYIAAGFTAIASMILSLN